MADEPELDKIRKGLEYHLSPRPRFSVRGAAEIERAREEEGKEKPLDP